NGFHAARNGSTAHASQGNARKRFMASSCARCSNFHAVVAARATRRNCFRASPGLKDFFIPDEEFLRWLAKAPPGGGLLRLAEDFEDAVDGAAVGIVAA